MENNEEIRVKIFDLKHGLVEYENVKFIKIVSKDYNLLIMKDYMPIIGEIDGDVSINGENVDLDYKQIKAYYIHKNNEFNLLIQDV